MFVKFLPEDKILNHPLFLENEVQYNLIHLISGFEQSVRIKTHDETMIFAHSPGHNAWIWLSASVDKDKKQNMMLKLCEYLEQVRLPGISGDPRIVEMFAKVYAEKHNVSYYPHIGMQSYFCPKVEKPINVKGVLQKASRQYSDIISEFLAGFSLLAFGVTVSPSSQLSTSEHLIDSGNLYLWIVDGLPVSMANIAHRSQRHARINSVFTPLVHQKKGYASSVVAEIGTILEKENLTPMLYADLKNPDSNKVYKNIGFIESGTIIDIKFTEEGSGGGEI